MLDEYLPVVLVSGGRDYADEPRVWAALDTMRLLYGDFILIHGNARGVDTYAENWAKARENMYLGCPAQWERFKAEGKPVKRAGTSRNAEMGAILSDVAQQRHALIFSGGRGTSNMCNLVHSLNYETPINIWLVDGEFWK